jgi:hypothetical protein
MCIPGKEDRIQGMAGLAPIYPNSRFLIEKPRAAKPARQIGQTKFNKPSYYLKQYLKIENV